METYEDYYDNDTNEYHIFKVCYDEPWYYQEFDNEPPSDEEDAIDFPW
jgi:hypothetical protein